jgi:hypothetical protein
MVLNELQACQPTETKIQQKKGKKETRKEELHRQWSRQLSPKDSQSLEH